MHVYMHKCCYKIIKSLSKINLTMKLKKIRRIKCKSYSIFNTFFLYDCYYICKRARISSRKGERNLAIRDIVENGSSMPLWTKYEDNGRGRDR